MNDPKAWIVYAENGNIRLWSADFETAQKFAIDKGRPLVPLYSIAKAPIAIIDTRALGLCAPTEEVLPALYALQGHRVALIDLGVERKSSGPEEDMTEGAVSELNAGLGAED